MSTTFVALSHTMLVLVTVSEHFLSQNKSRNAYKACTRPLADFLLQCDVLCICVFHYSTYYFSFFDLPTV